MTTLRGITWDHPRGIDALLAASIEFECANPGVSIEWTARPLASFEETPVTELAHDYDLVALDHPFIGDAVADAALLSLDGVMSAAELADRAADSAGRSHESYTWNGQQWALAVDAACMVSAYRPDLLGEHAAPQSWDDVAELSRSLGRDKLLIPANPTHLWGSFVSLCEALDPSSERQPDGRPLWWTNDGIDRERADAAYLKLREILALCSEDSLELNPIDVLARLGSDDESAYSPLTFGYVSYARPMSGSKLVHFADAPRLSDQQPGTLTGGVGLAISAHTDHPDVAARFVSYATDAEVQSGLYVNAGGQPGRRSAWQDVNVNATSADFYSASGQTMESSFLRPRFVGYPAYQRAIATGLHELYRDGGSSAQATELVAALWAHHVRP